jgi:NAD(P)-dependent dehydrogenase (short-subunit alcohol dehydrogenase family)
VWGTGVQRGVAEQVIVVVGATGAVGRATVLTALDRGARVVAVAHHDRELAALATEAGVPHRFETVSVRRSGGDIAGHVAAVTTARFGLLHTWVHVVDRSDTESCPIGAASAAVLCQLRRSGGGTFVMVAPERAVIGGPSRHALTDLELDLARVGAARHGRQDLASVTLVRRAGIVPPDRVAQTILRAAVRPQPEWVVRGSVRRDALVARMTPAPARQRLQGAWLFR